MERRRNQLVCYEDMALILLLIYDKTISQVENRIFTLRITALGVVARLKSRVLILQEQKTLTS
jgi:hypothetical protein